MKLFAILPPLEAVAENKLEQGTPLSLEELLKISIFQGVPKPLLEKNLGAVVLRRFRKGEVICREGEQGSTAFYILTGTAQVMIKTPFAHLKTKSTSRWGHLFSKMTSLFVNKRDDPRAQDTIAYIPIDAPVDLSYQDPVATLKIGDLFGEMTCLSFYPRSATVVAGESCEMLEMLQNVLQICQRNPTFKKQLDDNYRERALVTHMKSVPLFKTVSDDYLKQLKAKVTLVSYEPGTVICSEGDTADALYLVRIGFVKVTKAFPGGEMVLSYLPRGSFFGEMGLLGYVQDERRRSLRVPVHIPAKLTLKDQTDPIDVTVADLSNHGALLKTDHPIATNQGLLQFTISIEGTITRVQVQIRRTMESEDSATTIGVEFENMNELQATQIRQIYQKSSTTGVRSASCTALDHVELVRVGFEEMRTMMKLFPSVQEQMKKAAENRESANRYLMSVPRDVPLDDFLDHGLIQAQNLLILDLSKCTRCDACTEACAATHDGVTRLVREGLRYDNYLVATSCRQCMDPLCMVGCPVGSIRRKDSLEIIIEDWCIGCGLCARNCPYGNINMHPFEALEEDHKNPGVMKPVVKKKATTCDLCTDLPEPSCVYACPHDAAHRVDPKSFFGFQGSTPEGVSVSNLETTK